MAEEGTGFVIKEGGEVGNGDLAFCSSSVHPVKNTSNTTKKVVFGCKSLLMELKLTSICLQKNSSHFSIPINRQFRSIYISIFYWTLGGAILLVLALVSWVIFVAPMNAEFATWLTNPVPPDWTRYRNQWEYTHAINTLLKMIGLSLLVISVLVETAKRKVTHSNHS